MNHIVNVNVCRDVPEFRSNILPVRICEEDQGAPGAAVEPHCGLEESIACRTEHPNEGVFSLQIGENLVRAIGAAIVEKQLAALRKIAENISCPFLDNADDDVGFIADRHEYRNGQL